MDSHHSNTNERRVAVVGCGNVGSTFAYALLLRGLVTEIVLVDSNEAKAEGEALDLNHAVPFTRPVRVWAGELEDCADAAVTVIAAGVAQKPSETRIDLLARNVAVFREIVPQIAENNPHGIVLVATNPVDVLSYVTHRLSGLSSEKVIGSGTILDTARFRYLLGQRFGVDPRSVHAFIIGEHGDTEVPVWSLANIAGMPLQAFSSSQKHPPIENDVLEDLFRQTRDAAYAIIERKGATYYAVAAGLVQIVEAILRDQHTVLSVSTLVQDFYGVDDIFMSLPAVIGRRGVREILRLELNRQEAAQLEKSADAIKGALSQITL